MIEFEKLPFFEEYIDEKTGVKSYILTEKTVDIFSAMPKPKYPRSYWHLDPHPQFTSDGKYIVSTTTVRGSVDVAITPVEELIEMTK